MTLSELIDAIARQQTDLNAGDTALAVKALVTCMNRPGNLGDSNL